MDLQIKTFRIHTEADELALNAFLHNKIVRHWSTNFVPDTTGALGAISSALTGTQADAGSSAGVWNIFVAYEVRTDEGRSNDRSNQRASAGGNTQTRQRDQQARPSNASSAQ